MSVWQQTPSVAPLLAGSDGELVSVSIGVDPQRLEPLLEALSQVPFPINPEIYHDGAIVRRYADGTETAQATTLVEFPAYAGHLEEVRDTLQAFGFPQESLRVTGMLEEIQPEPACEAAPEGAGFVTSYRLKRRVAGAH